VGRSRKRHLPAEPLELRITGLSHDGRGIAESKGKKVFVHGALPGERVRARLISNMRRYDEAEALEVVEKSPDRVEPRCSHFGICGGCALQHLDPAAQIIAKQDSLLQNLERIGKLSPRRVLEPLTGPLWNYRRKARLSVRYVHKKERVLIGFRERKGHFVAELTECHVLDQRVAALLPQLTAVVGSMDARERIPQIEVSCGDRECALVVRHLDALNRADQNSLECFARENEIALMLQAGGPDTIRPLYPHSVELAYSVPESGLTLDFGPSDFVQINAELNRSMIHRALQLLQPGTSDRVLELFCGLGNFSLPIARRAGGVVGVEGDSRLVEKARHNARRNGIENAEFYVADLTAGIEGLPWMRRPYDLVLIDPPRSGSLEMLPHIAATDAHRLVYISCHPASLARDAGILCKDHGFELLSAGVMDMFPHTGHVESIALFERERRRKG